MTILHPSQLIFVAGHRGLEHQQPPPEELQNLNVGRGTDPSLHDLAELVAKCLGRASVINWNLTKSDDKPKKQLDVSSMPNLGWSARIGLKIGVFQPIENYAAKRVKS